MIQGNSLFCNREYFVFEISKLVCPLGYISSDEFVCICFDWFLVRDISLPAAQLFVIAIENILRRGVGNLTTVCLGSRNIYFFYFDFLCLIWHVIERYG